MRHRIYKLFAFLFVTTLFVNSVSLYAQTRPSSPRPATTRPAAKPQNPLDPNAGWSGVVTYTKTLTERRTRDEPIFGRIDKQKNRLSETATVDYKYDGRLFVDGRGPQLVTRAQVSLSDENKIKGEQHELDSCHAFNDEHYFIDESSDEQVTKAFAEGPAQGFNLNAGFLSDIYSFSFKFPKAKGVYSRETHVTHKGYCQPKNNDPLNQSDKRETTVEGESVSIDGKIDPEHPDVISGSKTWGGETSGGIPTYKYTVTWSFRRKPAPLELESVEFDEHPYPDFDSWKKIDDNESVDSNIVRIRAKVVNYSSETKFPKLVFKEQRSGDTLPDSETSISIAPGETREVEYLWDTSGWAWETGAKPMSARNIKVEMTEPTSPNKEIAKDFVVTPRPVILVHGLWADQSSWDGYEKNFYRYHSSIWRSFAVGKDPANGLMNTGEKGTWKPANTIVQNAGELAKQIEHVQKSMNAWHVDIVAHSMGGIISRSYINDRMKTVPDGKPTVAHLVMLGTPNMGSPCANLMGFAFWSLGKPVKSLDQLRPVYMEGFNKYVRNRKGVKFSNLVGTPVPITCQSQIGGDGVVEIPSAIWELSDVAFSHSVHTDLTSSDDFARYVIKRLAISHRGDNGPDTKNYGSLLRGEALENVNFADAGWSDDAPVLPENLKLNLAKELTLGPGQKTDVEVPFGQGAKVGVTFIAPPTVSASLIDEKGQVVGQDPANAPASRSDFRSLAGYHEGLGTWKLRLENTSKAEASVAAAAWSDTTPNALIITASKADAAGKVSIVGRPLVNNLPAQGAHLVARLRSNDGKTVTVTLSDDGKSGDGAAGDGVYGIIADKLAPGTYLVEAKAEIDGQTLASAAGFEIPEPEARSAKKAVQK